MVFDYLHKEINALRMLPGDKISEAEVAGMFEISRQPVRDAFSRLDNLGLLLIRPQKATEVRRFSMKAIVKSRFLRAAVEAEVVRRAASLCENDGASLLEACLDRQRTIVESGLFESFNAEDYAFHQTLCEIAGLDFAFELISEEKAKLDRLCVLSLSGGDRLDQLLDDHTLITNFVKDGKTQKAVDASMVHLKRLDATLEKISAENPHYFDE